MHLTHTRVLSKRVWLKSIRKPFCGGRAQCCNSSALLVAPESCGFHVTFFAQLKRLRDHRLCKKQLPVLTCLYPANDFFHCHYYTT